jgi:hypothetical protein
MEQALQYIKAGTWPLPAGVSDPYFNYVTMLLHGDGTNGAQNNTFLDSSINNFTITRNGNTTQGSFSPYGSNWSNYFDATATTPLYFPNSSNYTFNGNFTVECWFFATTLNEGKVLVSKWDAGGQEWTISIGTNKEALFSWGPYSVSIPAITSASNVFSLNVWNHIAAVRNSGVVVLYVNGVSVGTANLSSSPSNTGSALTIGFAQYQGTNKFGGYISNVRVVKGTAVYTTNFAVPTAPLTAIGNTQLLTCQSNRFSDNSTNNATPTVNGASVQRFSPFSPSAAYSTSTIGGSGYFDGSGDTIQAASNVSLTLGTADFTVECWINPGSQPGGYNTIIGGDSTGALLFSITGSGTSTAIIVNAYGSGSVYNQSYTFTQNAWHHIAVTRSGTNLKVFVNGTQLGGTVTDSTNFSAATRFIGGAGTTNQNYAGYVSDARIVKGTAVYTSAFTPPTAPLTAIANTSLLTNFTNGGIFDNAMMNNLETVGNAQISTSVFKYGTGSLAFDGTGDWLTAPNSKGLYIGSGDFTIEGWLYLNALGSIKGIVSQFNSGGSGPGWTLYTKTTNVLEFYGGSGTVTVTGTTAISATTWTHFAVVRNGSTITIYINGTAGGTATNSSFSDDTAALVYIGGRADNAALSLNGYIDDLRITKGYARYTSNFTPPAAAFPNN